MKLKNLQKCVDCYTYLNYKGSLNKINDFISKQKRTKYPCLVLIRNNFWNDYGFVSNFYAYFLFNAAELIYLGDIKIIMNEYLKENITFETILPEYFNKPLNNCYSRSCNELFYLNLRTTLESEIKNKILYTLNDVHYNNYDRNYVVQNSKNEQTVNAYDCSLFRSDWVDFDISSEYAEYSLNMLDKIDSIVTSLNKIEIENKDVLLRLLYGSIITALESYLHDAFKYKVFNEPGYFYSFMENYDFPKSEKKYTWKEIGLKGNKIKEFIENKVSNTIDLISFHNLSKIHAIYKDVLDVDLPNWKHLNDSIQKRHDIFHRCGKDVTGKMICINTDEITKLVLTVKKFIKDVELILITQL